MNLSSESRPKSKEIRKLQLYVSTSGQVKTDRVLRGNYNIRILGKEEENCKLRNLDIQQTVLIIAPHKLEY